MADTSILRQFGTAPVADPDLAQRIHDEALLGTRFDQGLRGATLGLGAGVTALGGDIAEGIRLKPAAEALRSVSDDLTARAQRANPSPPSYTDVLSGKERWQDYVNYAAGQAIPSFAAVMGGGVVGKRLLRSPVAGAYATGATLEAGETAGDLRQDPVTRELPVEHRLAASTVRGAAGGILEAAVPSVLLRPLKGARLGPGAGAVTGYVAEAATEASQQKLGQEIHSFMNAARDRTHDVDELIDSFLMGGLPGGVGGGIRGTLASMTGPEILPRPNPDEELAQGDKAPRMRDALMADDRERVAGLDAERTARTAEILKQNPDLGTDPSDPGTQVAAGTFVTTKKFKDELPGKLKDMYGKATALFKGRKQSLQGGEAPPEVLETLLSKLKPQYRDDPMVFDELNKIARTITTALMAEDVDSAQLAEWANSDLFADMFEDRVGALTAIAKQLKATNAIEKLTASSSAEIDATRKDSFFTNLVRGRYSPQELKKIGRVIDAYAAGKGPRVPHQLVVKELAKVFGSEERAERLLQFYESKHLTKDAAAPAEKRSKMGPDSDEELEEVDFDEVENTANALEPKMKVRFADEKNAMPYAAGKAPQEKGNKIVSMYEFVEREGLDPAKEAARILDRLKRLAEKGTEDQKAAYEAAKTLFETGGRLDAKKKKRLSGAESLLTSFEVIEEPSEQTDPLAATPQDMKAMRTLLDKKSNRKEPTRLDFITKDGKTFSLSAESMWRTWSRKRTDRLPEDASYRDQIIAWFSSALAAVLARDDMQGGYIIDKKTGEIGIGDDVVISRGDRITGADLKGKARREPTADMQAVRDEIKDKLRTGDEHGIGRLREKLQAMRAEFEAAQAARGIPLAGMPDLVQGMFDSKDVAPAKDIADSLENYAEQGGDEAQQVLDSLDEIKEIVTPRITHAQNRLAAARRGTEYKRIKGLEDEVKALRNDAWQFTSLRKKVEAMIRAEKQDTTDRQGVIETLDIGEQAVRQRGATLARSVLEDSAEKTRIFDPVTGMNVDTRAAALLPKAETPDIGAMTRVGKYDKDGEETMTDEQRNWLRQFFRSYVGAPDQTLKIKQIRSVRALVGLQTMAQANILEHPTHERRAAWSRLASAARDHEKFLTRDDKAAQGALKAYEQKLDDALETVRDKAESAKRAPGERPRKAADLVLAALGVTDLTRAEKQLLLGQLSTANNGKTYLRDRAQNMRDVRRILEARGIEDKSPAPVPAAFDEKFRVEAIKTAGIEKEEGKAKPKPKKDKPSPLDIAEEKLNTKVAPRTKGNKEGSKRLAEHIHEITKDVYRGEDESPSTQKPAIKRKRNAMEVGGDKASIDRRTRVRMRELGVKEEDISLLREPHYQLELVRHPVPMPVFYFQADKGYRVTFSGAPGGVYSSIEDAMDHLRAQDDESRKRFEAAVEKAKSAPQPAKFVIPPAANYVEFNKQNIENAKELSKKDKAQILKEAERILGPKIKVQFRKNFGAAGDFLATDTAEIIRLAKDMSAAFANEVLWHEATHAFMARLLGDKSMRETRDMLMRVAETPAIAAQLRNLLQGHKDALEQLDDREERVAYMFQFWVAGKLKLPKPPETFFQKILQFLRDVLGLVTEYEKAELLMVAMYEGRFADPGLISPVLADMHQRTMSEKMDAIAGPLKKYGNVLFMGATDRLRAFKTDAMNEAADMFYKEAEREGGELGFIQSRGKRLGEFRNRWADLMKDTTAVQRTEALRNLQAMKDPQDDFERSIKALLKDLDKYMRESGVKRFDLENKKWEDLGFVERYFPRVWDKENVRKNQEELVKLFMEEGKLTSVQAGEVIKHLLHTVGDPALTENSSHVGFTPYAKAINARKLHFINEKNAHKFVKFQSSDLNEIVDTYIYQATHRGEYARFFGNAGEKIQHLLAQGEKEGMTKDEREEASRIIMALEGTIGYDMNPKLRDIYGGLVVFQNVALLPFALFASLIDPIGVGLRSGDMNEAWYAFVRGMKDIVASFKDEGIDPDRELARTMGLIDSNNMLENYGNLQHGMYMSSFLKNVNNKYFRWNGMEGWNHSMRIAGMTASMRFILKHADRLNWIDGLGPRTFSGDTAVSTKVESGEASARYLKELGLEKGDVKELPDGRIATSQDEGLTEEQEKRVKEAIFRFVDGGVLRPNAAHRAVWMSDPHYMLIAHLKQFTYSFHNTIIRRMVHEVKNGNHMAIGIFLAYVPFMIAADLVRGGLTGNIKQGWDLIDYLGHGVERSAVLGKSQFIADVWQDAAWGKTPGSSLLGPTFEHATKAVNYLAGSGGGESLFYRSMPAGPLLKSVVQ